MGVTVSTYCKRCGVEGPEMGDFGYVGAPSLGPGKKRGGLTPFGVLFDGFAALGMVTEELAAFKAFLDAHADHPIVQSAEGDEEEFGDNEGVPAPSGRRKAFRARVRAVDAFYEIHCAACADAFRTASSERVVPFEEFAPTAAAVLQFRENVARVGGDDFYKVGGFPYDDTPAVDAFLRQHRGHPLRVRLDRGRPPRVQPAAGAGAPAWAPPAGRIEDHEHCLGRVSETTLVALAGLNHRDPARRAESCRALREAREGGALGYVCALADDPADEVRAAAAEAIGALEDPRAARALGRFLLDPADSVRQAAGRALAVHGLAEEDALREARALRGPYPLRSSGREVKVKPAPEAVEAALADPESDATFEAVEVLKSRAGQPWARDLFRVLAVHSSWSTRNHAAKLLGQDEDPRARWFLLALLEDRHPCPAASAAEALGELKAQEAVPALLDALTRGVRSLTPAAGRALAAIRDPSAAESLVAALRSESPDVQKAALEGLGGLRDPRTAEAMAPFLASAVATVREAAAYALGAAGGAEAVAALSGLARSASELDRKRAVWGLDAMLPDPAAIEALIPLLRDPMGWVRGDATAALGNVQDDPTVHRALAESAQRGNRAVAQAAWRVLIREGGAAAEKDLIAAMTFESREEAGRDYLSSGNAALAAAARKAFRGRKLPAGDSGIRWGQGASP